MKEQPTRSDNLGDLRRQARLNELRLKIARQNEALAALRRAGCRDSLEGFYDSPANLFDPRDYLIEVPRGLGGGLPTTRNDRDQGRDFPIFRTEQELAVIRGAARLLTSTSPIAVGILTTLTNYVIGPGFHYAAAPRADMSLVGAGQLAATASRLIDEFLDENDWLGDLDRELFQRSRVDGEYFLGLWHVGNGHVQARAVEPDQVTEPSNKLGLDEWLGCVSEAGCAATSPASGWTFGVHTDDVDSQGIHGFYVQWTDRDTEWDYFPGGNEPILSPDGAALWMEHAKLNVVRGVKRGLSDFFAVQGNLDLARRVLRNMGEGSAVQAAIAWIQEVAPGTTQAQTSSATLARADARYTTQTSQGSRQHTAQHYDPATILKVPNGQKYLPGPLGSQNAPSFITAAEALLRTVAVRWSLPENLVTGTAENNNFASSLVAESPFVKFAESQQQFYARRDRRTLKRVLWFAWSAGRFGDVPWSLVDRTIEITVTPPQIEVRDPEKETQVRAALHAAGILSKKTWSAQEGLDFDAEQRNLAEEARAEAKQAATGGKNNAPSANSSHAQANSASTESLEADWDPSKHPRGGNPENRGEFSNAAGPRGPAAKGNEPPKAETSKPPAFRFSLGLGRFSVRGAPTREAAVDAFELGAAIDDKKAAIAANAKEIERQANYWLIPPSEETIRKLRLAERQLKSELAQLETAYQSKGYDRYQWIGGFGDDMRTYGGFGAEGVAEMRRGSQHRGGLKDSNGDLDVPGGLAYGGARLGARAIAKSLGKAAATRGARRAAAAEIEPIVRSSPPAGQRGIWDIVSIGERGAAAEMKLGGRTGLHPNFPVIDRFENGIATSVKTMDLGADTYKNLQSILSAGKKYIQKASEFCTTKPVDYADMTIRPSDVTQRALDLVVPPWSTPAQREALQELVEYGSKRKPPVLVRIVESK